MKNTRNIIAGFCGAAVLMYFSCKNIDMGSLKYERMDPDCPEAIRLSPAGAHFGETVTIIGNNFFPGKRERHQIFINGKAIPQDSILSVPSSDSLLFKVPKGVGSGKVEVRITDLVCNGSQMNGPEFTYYYTATTVSFFAGDPNLSNGDNFLFFPTGLDIDNGGNIWVADKLNYVIRKINQNGGIVRTIGTPKAIGCNASSVFDDINARFRNPVDVAVSPSGIVYVAEENNNTIRIINSTAGVNKYGTCQTPPTTAPPASVSCESVLFAFPQNLAFDGSELYVADGGRIRKIMDNTASCFVNTLNAFDGVNKYASIIDVSRARAGIGPLIVLDDVDKKLKSVDENGIISMLPMTSNPFDQPSAISVDKAGNVFIADSGNHKIFVVYTNGDVILLAGTGNKVYTGNTLIGLNANFDTPSGLALSENNGKMDLYVSDSGHNIIRKIKIE